MKSYKLIAMLLWLVPSTVIAPLAQAQVPPHLPGTICVTPKFWCWVSPPGQVNQPCSCPSPYGPVAGVYQ